MMKKLMFCSYLVFLAVLAQASSPKDKGASSKKASPVFSSYYTDIQKECKPNQSGTSAVDTPWTCPLFQDYQASISWSATRGCLFVQRIGPPKDKYEKALPVMACDWGEMITTRKLEWRLADGKPFAVIIRRYDWDPATDEDPEQTKESLVVKGLVGFNDTINAVVETFEEPRANEEARMIADGTYQLVVK